MDNLRSTIDILFNHTSPEHILYLTKINSLPLEKVDKDWFIAHFGNRYNAYTNDQIAEMHNMLCSQWLQKPNGEDAEKSLLHVPLHFTKEVLTEYNGEPVCKYEHLLRWRELTLLTGEDMLTAAFLAYSDLGSNMYRYFFSWRPVLTHNNQEIHVITEKGLAELHFHLGGSTLIFTLNWLSLMNDIRERRKAFDELNILLSPNVSTTRGHPQFTLPELVVIAAEIRAALYEFLFYNTPLTEGSLNFPELNTGTIQQRIDALRFFYGKRYGNEKSIIDYAIPESLSEKEMDKNYFVNTVLSGERRFLYKAFHHIYSRAEHWRTVEKMFFTYLLIKNIFARELVQNNERVGFANFKKYQDRKEAFIKKNSIYKKIICELAIKTSFDNQHLDYLEARIIPKDDEKEMRNTIQRIREHVSGCRQTIHQNSYAERFFSQNRNDYNYYFILHFIKSEDKNKDKDSLGLRIRHRDLRNEVRRQAMAIQVVREQYPSIAKNIAAIDAASAEQNARPEVFAQAFRFLRGRKIPDRFAYLRDDAVPDLRVTYHVGEDYIDIVDGLRAVDETIIFLNLTHCDRLGHALVLGDDPKLYYKRQHHTLTMSKQCFLDNAVWMIHKSRELGINLLSSVLGFLETSTQRYSQEIYGESYSSSHLYDAWLLRGDNPYRYFSDSTANSPYPAWSGFDLNEIPKCVQARENKDARKLYYQYHFDNSVKTKGQESVNKKIDESLYDDYITAITEIQKEMRKEISKKHILIETNLSSNRKIGGMRKYKEHPITKFYNIGLTYEQTSCPQISVSINTDDQGVFSTSIENEFALMAIALEKEGKYHNKYRPQMIYQWLDTIRENAFSQRFVKN